MAGHDGGTKAVVAALVANLGIAATKFVAYALTQSSSMLAEAIHSIADSGNQVLLLIGGRRARKTADAEHPFGYGRVRYLYAFLVSVVLFAVGGLFALYEGYSKWQHPHGIDGRWWWVPLVVLTIAIGLESNSFRVAIREAKLVKGGQSWGQYIRQSRAPELPVILLEDFAALLGLILALGGVSLTLLTGDGRWDAIGTLLIGVLLVVVAVVLAFETGSMLIGEAAVPEREAQIRAALVGGGILNVIHMRTLHLGGEEILVAAKVGVAQGRTGEEIAADIDAAEVRARATGSEKLVMFLEPDITRTNA